MAKARDFAPVFDRLRAILAAYAPGMTVEADDGKNYALRTHKIGPNGHPVYFAGVRLGKNYVSYYLMPVYGCAELREGVSEALQKRMQGKACFNFREVDEGLMSELAGLTALSLERFRKAGLA
jgi:hypothetical protein